MLASKKLKEDGLLVYSTCYQLPKRKKKPRNPIGSPFFNQSSPKFWKKVPVSRVEVWMENRFQDQFNADFSTKILEQMGFLLVG